MHVWTTEPGIRLPRAERQPCYTTKIVKYGGFAGLLPRATCTFDEIPPFSIAVFSSLFVCLHLGGDRRFRVACR